MNMMGGDQLHIQIQNNINPDFSLIKLHLTLSQEIPVF